jgi:hypothetical protein
MDQREFAPDLQLGAEEVTQLAGIVFNPGFKVLQKIGKNAVDAFVLDWVNAKTDFEVLSKHKSAQVAAQFYTLFINRINQEVTDYVGNEKLKEKPIDAGENLDMGDWATGNDYEESLT